MLKEIKLKNFKNISNSKIIIRDQLTGIYGPNGSGKTSVIEAFLIFKLFYTDQKSEEVKKDINNSLIKNVNSKMKQGQNEMILEFIFSKNDYHFKFTIVFISNNNEIITCEEISYLTRTSKEYTSLYVHDKREISNYFNSAFTYSCFGNPYEMNHDRENAEKILALNSSVKKNSEEIKNLTPNRKPIIKSFKQVLKYIDDSYVIELQDQAIINMKMLLPFDFHRSDGHGTIPLIQFEHKYDERDYNQLVKIIAGISELFQILAEGRKLRLNVVSESADEKSGILRTLCLDIIGASGEKINISDESTGTCKIISVLSAINNFMVSEDAFVLIDELDSHIFEYLVSSLLAVLNDEKRGQMIFTAHNLTVLESLKKDNILLASKDSKQNIIFSYFNVVNKSENRLRNEFSKMQFQSEKN